MTWLQLYQIRHYFRNSIWILPLASIVVALEAVVWLQGVGGKGGTGSAPPGSGEAEAAIRPDQEEE